MALYTVSSSGRLKIADTGIGLPVSIFYGDGSALATAPLGGDFNKVYVFNGNYNRITSTGNLKFYSGSYDLEGLLAGAALGEQALGGGLAKTQQLSVGKYFITGIVQSSGQLRLSGSSFAVEAYRAESNGQLRISGSTVARVIQTASSAGRLRLSGTKVAPSRRLFNSSGSLKLFPADAYRVIQVESATTQLRLTGYSGIGLKFTSSGNLRVTGSFTRNISLTPTSSGLLDIVTEWYTVNRIGGVATEALASAPIAAGSGAVQNILNTTGKAFYGRTGLTSTGNLTLGPIGTPASDLSQDGALAGGPLAFGSITERRFNPDRTQFRQLQNINSAGQLRFDLSVKYRIDSEGAQLVVTGQAGFNNDRRSSGQLLLTGSDYNTSTRTERSAGQLRLNNVGENPLASDSGIGGSALASLPLGGGRDLIAGVTKVSSLRIKSTSGNLKLNGLTGVGLKRLSSGQLVLTGGVVTRSIRIESTSGQLKLSSTQALRSIRTVISNGSLTLTHGEAFRDTWTEGSSGQLRLTGSSLPSSTRRELTSGQLRLTGSDYNTSTRTERSAGQLRLSNVGENPLALDSSLGSSALASLPLGGGCDLIKGNTTFNSLRTEITSGTPVFTGSVVTRSLRIELSSGQLRLTGSSLPSSTRRELTSGQLRLTGSDYNTSTRTERSAGQLRISGSVVTRSLRNEQSTGSWILREADAYRIIWTEGSSGQLRISGTDYNTSTRTERSAGQLRLSNVGENPLALDSSLGSSALASLPLGGGVDLIAGVTKVSSTKVEITNGQLTLSGTLATSSTRLETTAAQLKLTGSTNWNRRPVFNTSGRLTTNGSLAVNVKHSNQTSGQLYFINAGLSDAPSQSGALGGSPIAFSPIAGNTEQVLFQTKVTYVLDGRVYNDSGFTGASTGNLKLTGSTVSRSLRTELTTGQLIVTGTHSNNSRHAETSQGQLRLSGSDYQATVHGQSTTGRLAVTGSVEYNKQSTYSTTSSGQIILSGVTEITIISDNGNINSISSSGGLHITGTATASTGIAPKVTAVKENRGGSYVYATSWDILSPYFPDDRHILGYIELKTSGIGIIGIGGTSTVEVVKGKPAVPVKTGKSLADYIAEISTATSTIEIKQPIVVKAPKVKISQQAFLEDEMLLNGDLLDLDPTQDELDRELLF
jgi:hypothetical protein